MKISNIQPIQSVQKYKHNQERPAEAKGRSDKKEDQVQISDKAKELLKNTETKSSAESARAEKLQRIKQELDNGTYEVDARKLAEKLLPVLKRDNDDSPKD